MKWERIAPSMQCSAVRPYFDLLQKKRLSLMVKRLFDIVVSLILLILFSPFLVILTILIKLDSRGPAFYRQVRVTKNMREFKIFKFRTMIVNADKIGTAVTVANDKRITRMGKIIRKIRVDEIPQLINVFLGDMSFVGTRPEVPKYVSAYTDEMKATLLLRAGITSLASIKYKDEDTLLKNAENADECYINEILPGKMSYNLEYIKKFGFFYDIFLMFKTAIKIFF